jgi:hypothetical protein
MGNVLPILRYVAATVLHKAFVVRAGRRTGTPLLQLLLHDLSKFTPAELPHYARQFFGDRSDPQGFARAWLHHQNHNRHHWEYWIARTSHINLGTPLSENIPLEMPERYVREMVADWMAASRLYIGAWPESVETWAWLKQARPRMRLHDATATLLDRVLAEAFRNPLG